MTDRTKSIELTKLHAGQRTVVEGAGRYNVLECGRRFGKTTLGEVLAAIPAINGSPVGWFAPTYNYLNGPWDSLADTLRPITSSINKNERQIKLITGGGVDFWTLDNPDAGRGRKYKRVIIDEGGIARNLQAAWEQAIRPTLADLSGDAWFLGTPKGHGYFHKLFARGEQNVDGWKSWRLPTTANPNIKPEEVEAARRDMPPDFFNQEFLGIPAADGGNPFDMRAIEECTAPSLAAGPPVSIGVDLAKSHDWTVVCGLNAEGHVCLLERWQSDWSATRERVAGIVAMHNAATLVDATGVGAPIVEDLQRTHRKVDGFVFTSQTKQELMGGLAHKIHARAVRFPDGWLRSELESFTYEYHAGGRVSYTAPPGLHDDGVCALALAVRHWVGEQSRPKLDFAFISADDEGSDAWGL